MPEDQKSVPKKKAQPHWLQQQVLQRLLQTEESVEVVQINGERVRGVVVGFDTYGILLETEDKNACFLFKHGVSAIHGGKDLLRRRKPTEGNDS